MRAAVVREHGEIGNILLEDGMNAPVEPPLPCGEMPLIFQYILFLLCGSFSVQSKILMDNNSRNSSISQGKGWSGVCFDHGSGKGCQFHFVRNAINQVLPKRNAELPTCFF